MKKPLLTIMGALLLLSQAPLAIGEDTVTISVKDLNALKSLCTSINGATKTSAAASAKTVVSSVPAASTATPTIGKAVKVASLRGFHDLDKEAKPIEKKKQFKISGGIEKNWVLQPPSIPHSIEKDRITLQGNTCMKCHSKENHEKEKAPQVAESHYKTRDGKTLKKLSTRRYFCVQCHTPQADAKPLVENIF